MFETHKYINLLKKITWPLVPALKKSSSCKFCFLLWRKYAGLNNYDNLTKWFKTKCKYFPGLSLPASPTKVNSGTRPVYWSEKNLHQRRCNKVLSIPVCQFACPFHACNVNMLPVPNYPDENWMVVKKLSGFAHNRQSM